MPDISVRGRKVPMSPFRKLMPSAQVAKKEGTEVIHLNIGQPDIKTPLQALQNIQKERTTVVKYSPGVGVAELRNQFSKYLKRKGLDFNSEQIIVTSGASEGLYFIFISCFESGDEVIVPEPFYANYNGFAHMTGVKIVPVTCKIEDNFRLPEIEEIERKIGKNTRAILITNPNNPTGQVYEQKKLIALGKLAKKHDLFLISDEVYQDFCFSETDFFSVASIKNLEENGLWG
jgi:aspartate aminotransferase